MKAVCVRDVSFGYSEGLVLDNINFTIEEGDYIGIVGPNGSGKSTLLKLMLGIMKPQKGTIEIFGQNISSYKGWGKIGYVPQKAASFNTSFPATVEEVVGANLFSKIGLFKPIKKSDLDLVYKYLDIVGMREYSKRLIGNLSGGQQQKVFIARALVSSPEMIFLDEPTVGIDVKSQQEFFELLDRLNKELKITIAIVSHDIGVITQKVGTVACLGNKKIAIHENTADEHALKDMLRDLYGDNMRILLHEH
ncbi:high-affinity zinc uptake system ATP-binding protein ZnuC [Oxobacter pfennigii]|uniref:High-affinity zinc uptake system ATP-binding protein ZnuC n=1 Tax=Oxobacter pfennigii TaxID=36849 RepID=A0A0N8NTP6_9CLOT|nr:metal ABC transporter ATP-binding protein [Oxobacter pfennigii]KPU45416.1 high-affinity zinc uptake system ATP-binding protein ZnuC [Oxobacter pfennigii]